MAILAPLAAIGLLTTAAIVLLYFLKVKRPEVKVATLMFWRPYLADRQANAPWQRLKYSLLLLLQLLTALALAVGLMRPGLTGAAGVARTTVVMIDASPSMEATDVRPTRFGAAVEKTRELAGQMTPGETMAVILAGPHAQLLVAPSGDGGVVRSALDRARPAGSPGDFGEAISLDKSILTGRPGGSIILIGAGQLNPTATPPRIAVPLTSLHVVETAENLYWDQ